MRKEEFVKKWNRISTPTKGITYGEYGNCREIEVDSYKYDDSKEALFCLYGNAVSIVQFDKILDINGIVNLVFVNGLYEQRDD